MNPDLQPAPKAILLSFCTITLESFSVSFSTALRREGYSDWSVGYIPTKHACIPHVFNITYNITFNTNNKGLSNSNMRGLTEVSTCLYIYIYYNYYYYYYYHHDNYYHHNNYHDNNYYTIILFNTFNHINQILDGHAYSEKMRIQIHWQLFTAIHLEQFVIASLLKRFRCTLLWWTQDHYNYAKRF